MVDWCLRQRGLTCRPTCSEGQMLRDDVTAPAGCFCRVWYVSIRPEAELQRKADAPALPLAGIDLIYFQQSLPTADSALDPISPMASCPICAPENDSYLSSKVPKVLRRFVSSRLLHLRINRVGAAAKTVVCCTAIPLGSSYALAGRVLTPPWICSCLVALLMR